MEDYRGYAIDIEPAHGMWRCMVTPISSDFSILRSYSRYYATETEAIADAKRRVDKLYQPCMVRRAIAPNPASKPGRSSR
jgi:hypothetical protein